MGKQINFWQSNIDEQKFIEYLLELQLIIQKNDGQSIDATSHKKITPRIGKQYLIAQCGIKTLLPYEEKAQQLSEKYFHASDYPVIEYDTCEDIITDNHFADEGIHYIDVGRLWIDSRSSDMQIMRIYEKICRWIKKNYLKIGAYYVGTDMVKQLIEERCFATQCNASMRLLSVENGKLIYRCESIYKVKHT